LNQLEERPYNAIAHFRKELKAPLPYYKRQMIVAKNNRLREGYIFLLEADAFSFILSYTLAEKIDINKTTLMTPFLRKDLTP
jgi:hypothetical protein